VAENNNNELNFAENKLIKLDGIGEYFIEWKRRVQIGYSNSSSPAAVQNESDLDDDDEDDESDENDDDNHHHLLVKTRLNLPEINVYFFPFHIQASIPSYACMNQTIHVTYSIQNRTQNQTLDLECNLDENEFFSLSGKKREVMQILPQDSEQFKFVLFPLQVGYCKLPQFHLELNNYNVLTGTLNNTNTLETNPIDSTSYLNSIVQNMLPSQLFVFPEKLTDEYFVSN
jgi:hypothetical protein